MTDHRPAHPHAFPHAHRLHGREDFTAVYNAKMRKSSGPLLVFTRPSDRPQFRLGLSVSRKVGNAVVRGRVKRMLREAFRLTQPSWSTLDGGGLDLVVVVRPHTPAALTEYQRHLTSTVEAAVRGWAKRQRGDARPAEGD